MIQVRENKEAETMKHSLRMGKKDGKRQEGKFN